MHAACMTFPPFYQQVGEESQHGIAGLEDLSPGLSYCVNLLRFVWHGLNRKTKRSLEPEGSSCHILFVFQGHSSTGAKERTTCSSGRNSELSSCVVQFQRSETSKNPSKLDSGVTSVWHCQSIVNRLKELEGSESERGNGRRAGLGRNSTRSPCTENWFIAKHWDCLGMCFRLYMENCRLLHRWKMLKLTGKRRRV